MTFRLLSLLCGLACLWATAPASAQSRGGTSSAGVQTITPTSTAGGGGSSMGGGSTMSSASSFGGSSTGAGAGRTGTGAQTGTTGGGLSQPQFLQFGQAAQNVGTGFVGRGNNGQTFIGAQGAGQQTINAGGTPQFSGLGGGGVGGINGGGQVTSQMRGGQMRVPQMIAFSVPVVPLAATQASLQTQFATLPGVPPGVQVTPGEEGFIRLEGTVADEHSRRLAEALARMEPGVRGITNNLAVGNVPAGPTLP